MRTTLLPLAIVTAVLVTDPSITLGQQADTLEEITVTATRREVKLQDVPLSVTAFSQTELSQQGIVGYEGLARETPGIVLNKQSDNFNNFTEIGRASCRERV